MAFKRFESIEGSGSFGSYEIYMWFTR